jgi:hypothetical protein
LASLLADDGVRDGRVMATALRQLVQQARPSNAVIPGLLEGLGSIDRLTARSLAQPRGTAVAAVGTGA